MTRLRRASAKSVRRPIANRLHLRPHCSARCRENHWMVGSVDCVGAPSPRRCQCKENHLMVGVAAPPICVAQTTLTLRVGPGCQPSRAGKHGNGDLQLPSKAMDYTHESNLVPVPIDRVPGIVEVLQLMARAGQWTGAVDQGSGPWRWTM